MPVTPNLRIERAFGPDCLLAITQFNGFLGALAQNYATVVGTLTEVATAYGVGLRASAGNSYAKINWRKLCPEGAAPRSIFTQIYWPDSGTFGSVSFGAAGVRDYTFLGAVVNQWWGGINGDWDAGGVAAFPCWVTLCLTNDGVNGGANIVYANGVQAVAGTNGAAAVSTYDDLYLMSIRGAVNTAVGTVLQNVLAFRRVLSPADVLRLHEICMGARL